MTSTPADTPLPAPPAAPTGPPRQTARARSTALLGYAWLLLVIVCVGAMSWTGLVGFGRDILGLSAPLCYGVPISLDGSAVTLAFFALRSVLSGGAAGLPRLLAVAVVGASSGFNYYAARAGGQGGAAEAFFAGMSVLVYVMFEVVLRHLRRQHLAEIGAIEAPLARFRLARWLRYPGRTFRAWSAAVDRNLTDPAEALQVVRQARADRRRRRAPAPVARRPVAVELEEALEALTLERDLPAGVEGAIDVPERPAAAREGSAREVVRQLLDTGETLTRAKVKEATGVSDSRAGQLLRDERARRNGNGTIP